MLTSCRVCGGVATIDRPELAVMQATCTVCGWHYTHRGLALAHVVRQTEQYAFLPGGGHLCKRIGRGPGLLGSIACDDAEQWPRRAA